jgi:hypothetical protein
MARLCWQVYPGRRVNRQFGMLGHRQGQCWLNKRTSHHFLASQVRNTQYAGNTHVQCSCFLVSVNMGNSERISLADKLNLHYVQQTLGQYVISGSY